MEQQQFNKLVQILQHITIFKTKETNHKHQLNFN